jgi:hypothetical protein
MRSAMDTVAASGHKQAVRWWRWLALLLLAAALVAGSIWFGARAKGGDRELPVYVTGGERMAAGEEIYRRGTDSKPFTYPPFAAVPFVPFAQLPRDWQPAAWFALNFAVLLLMLVWLHRAATLADAAIGDQGIGRLPRAWFWLLTALFAGRHLASVFENQSHDLLVFATVLAGAAAWARQRTVSAGAWAGLGAACKATPLLFVELFALARSWRAAAMLLATFALLSLLPDLLFPRGDGRSWVLAWYDVNLRGLAVGGTADAAGAWNPHSFLNQSLSGVLRRLLTPVEFHNTPFVREDTAVLSLTPGAFRAVSLAVQLGVAALIGWGVLRAAASERREPALARWHRLGAAGLVLCGMVLLSPQSSKSHFCVLLLPAAYCVERLLRGRREPAFVGALAGALLLGPLAAKGLVGNELGDVLLAYGSLTWSTLLLLSASVLALGPQRAAAIAAGDGAQR